jgi:glyoxylase-like metal-dependent hydrolase (beta-lactamase superfamily II)
VTDICDRLYTLILGYEYQPREVIIAEGGDEVLELPFTAVVAHNEAGWFLFDTGLSRAVVDDEATWGIWWKWGAPKVIGDGDPLVDGLARCNLTPADIAGVGISHLHVDHGGGLRSFAGGTPIYIQEAELAFAMDDEAAGWGYWPEDYADVDLRWHTLAGDAQIAPGIRAVSTPGHTPGHQSFQFDMASGERWVFAYDALVTKENVELDSPVNVGSVASDVAGRQASHDRLMGMRNERRLIPGHCPWTWPELAQPPDHHG